MSTDNAMLYTLERHLLEDERPSEYLLPLSQTREFAAYPLVMLKRLADTEQSPIHHPEGSVWNHTLLVVDEAARVKEKSRNARAFMWAALLHDTGKPATTRVRKDKITAYNHDRAGAELAAKFLSCFTDDIGLIDAVRHLVRYHMHILYVVNGLPFADIEGMKRHTDITEVALLGLCDRLGRTGADRAKEEENIRRFLARCTQSDNLRKL